MSSNPAVALRAHWALVLVALAALPLLFAGLGSDYLWADEGDTAVLASNTLKFGVPKAWDGVTFTDSDKGARVNDDLVMVSHPWLQYYVAAASFAMFGEDAFAARLPFAFAGWLTIIAAYLLVWRVSANRSAAFCAAALLMFSVQFLLYARQSRYYAISMLLTCVLVLIFLRMKSAKQSALFAAIAVLLFHAHPVGIVIVAALAVVTLGFRAYAAQRRWFWFALPAILLFTFPWLALAPHGHGESAADLRTFAQFVARLGQFAIESMSVTPLIGCVLLLLCGVAIFRKTLLTRDEAGFLIIVALAVCCYAAAMIATQSAHALWYIGVRYAPAMIPLVACAAGILIVRVARERTLIWMPLLVFLAFTKIALLTPWLLRSNNVDPPHASKLFAVHVPATFLDRFIDCGELLFVRSLGRQNPGTVGTSAEFLRAHAARTDLLITNYEWDPLYFHTRLPQALKILADYPIVETARRKQLPEYVFDITGVRWVLWRAAWDGYLDYYGEQIERAIVSRGGRAEQVAEFPETVWENRENIHFHRFAGGRYLFATPSDLPAARLFRVDWP
jgi:4-amino-4-deoxy-L-arabinose transferase-like glycosyltransferase